MQVFIAVVVFRALNASVFARPGGGVHTGVRSAAGVQLLCSRRAAAVQLSGCLVVEEVGSKFSVALRPQGRPGRPPRLSHSSRGLLAEQFKFRRCCFTSTETVRTIKDGEPRTSTSTLTQPLSSEGGYTNVYPLQLHSVA